MNLDYLYNDITTLCHTPLISHNSKMSTIKLALAFIVFSIANSQPLISNTTADLNALIKFKSQLHTPFALSSWDFASSFCSWRGVSCNDSVNPNRVTALQLSSLQLYGVIDVSLANLTFLRILDLSGNIFYGSIPRELSFLQQLEILNLAFNHLEGEIPGDLARCSNMKSLIFSSNNLDGVIPSNFGSFRKLHTLHLRDNKLGGYISPSLGRIISLKTLSLSYNSLKGDIPVELGQLKNLKLLDLQYNSLSGRFPNFISNLTSLLGLGLAGNYLSGNLPYDLGTQLPNLKHLYLYNNRFEGQIPLSLSLAFNLKRIELSNNKFSGVVPPHLGTLQNLTILSLSRNLLGAHGHFDWTFLTSLKQCRNLRHLLLSNNQIHGPLPNFIGNITSLRTLDFSQNYLTGEIPKSLENFPFLRNLNLSFNNFQGEVPTGGVFNNTNLFSVDGNANLCGGIPKLKFRPCSSNGHQKLSVRMIIILTTSASCCIIMSVAVYIVVRHKRKTQLSKDNVQSHRNELMNISRAKLLVATDNFSSSNVIGSGSHGYVYKGTLEEENHEVAVKVLNRKGVQSFAAECEVLKTVRHRNVVKIIGTSSSMNPNTGTEWKAIVYEYMHNGTLESWLHHTEGGRRILTLAQRFNIIIDIAQAIHYLHDLIAIPIVHCDVKTSNILLNEGMNAHVGDFGLAQYLNQTDDIGINGGTIGYIAPECAMGSTLSTKWDVYSFGIVVLETFTGKRPTDGSFVDGLTIRKYVEASYPDKIMDVVDPRLQNEVDETHEESIREVLRIGLICSRIREGKRMSMKEVVLNLAGLKFSAN